MVPRVRQVAHHHLPPGHLKGRQVRRLQQRLQRLQRQPRTLNRGPGGGVGVEGGRREVRGGEGMQAGMERGDEREIWGGKGTQSMRCHRLSCHSIGQQRPEGAGAAMLTGSHSPRSTSSWRSHTQPPSPPGQTCSTFHTTVHTTAPTWLLSLACLWSHWQRGVLGTLSWDPNLLALGSASNISNQLGHEYATCASPSVIPLSIHATPKP